MQKNWMVDGVFQLREHGMDKAIQAIQQALDLVKSLQVIEGTDKDDVERLLESALIHLKTV